MATNLEALQSLQSLIPSRFRQLTKQPSELQRYIMSTTPTDDPNIKMLLGDEEVDAIGEVGYNAAVAALNNKITDVIYVKQTEVMDLLRSVVDLDKNEPINFSPDILFANTIPLKNFRIHIKMNDEQENVYDELIYEFRTYERCPVMDFKMTAEMPAEEAANNLTKAKIEVVPFEKIAEYYRTAGQEFETIIADICLLTVRAKYHSKLVTETVMKIPISMSSKKILYRPDILEWKGGGKDLLKRFVTFTGYLSIPPEVDDELDRQIVTGILMYYGINVLLLNPVIEEVFENKSSKEQVSTGAPIGKNKKDKIRYIKRHVLNSADVDEAFEKRGFVRRTMIWYVTGHWREYKSGKRIFIQGYWKGALRDIKAAVEVAEEREREMVVPENKEDT